MIMTENGKIKKDKQPTSVLLNFRVHPSTKEQWQAYAKDHADGKMSRFIRMAVRDFIDKIEQEKITEKKKAKTETEFKFVNEQYTAILERFTRLEKIGLGKPREKGVAQRDKRKSQVLALLTKNTIPLMWDDLVGEAWELCGINEGELDEALEELSAKQLVQMDEKARWVLNGQ